MDARPRLNSFVFSDADKIDPARPAIMSRLWLYQRRDIFVLATLASERTPDRRRWTRKHRLLAPQSGRAVDHLLVQLNRAGVLHVVEFFFVRKHHADRRKRRSREGRGIQAPC